MPEVSSNGQRLAYDERGVGAPLVLIMGIASQMIWWDEEFCDRLAAMGSGFRVIRFDNRDIGCSSRCSGKPDIAGMIPRILLGRTPEVPYTLHDMAADTIGLLDALGIDRAHLVGVSMGGLIGQCVAIDAPSRVRSLTCIASTTGTLRQWLARPQTVLSFVTRRPPKTREEAVTGTVELFRTLHGARLPFEEARTRRTAERAYDRGHYPEGFLRHLAAILASEDRAPALRRSGVPVQILHGTEDPLLSYPGVRAAAQALPATFHTCEGMGHCLPPAVWPDVLRWIAEFARASEKPAS